ncbi:MAG: diacylglycerol kinase [Parcubacteria group bacterium GW2011_GWE2_39_37]|nr:MAG: diacylglycerol kinase [Parcubacteria group bacterium GW2011_GWE2_39_37]
MIRFKRLYKSFTYAFRGLLKTFREEQNLRVQTIAALMAIILAVFLRIERLEWALLIFSISLVILMEILNSAVERVSDVLKPRISSYVKEIKDIMAAAVLLSALSAVVIGLIIFLPYLID